MLGAPFQIFGSFAGFQQPELRDSAAATELNRMRMLTKKNLRCVRLDFVDKESFMFN